MNVKSIGLMVVACGLALMVNGCITIQQPPTSGSAPDCTWTFSREPSGKVDPKSLVITPKEGKDPKACTKQETTRFSIMDPDNDWSATVTDTSVGEFKTGKDVRGFCRYCYPSPGGGMICIIYPC